MMTTIYRMAARNRRIEREVAAVRPRIATWLLSVDGSTFEAEYFADALNLGDLADIAADFGVSVTAFERAIRREAI